MFALLCFFTNTTNSDCVQLFFTGCRNCPLGRYKTDTYLPITSCEHCNAGLTTPIDGATEKKMCSSCKINSSNYGTCGITTNNTQLWKCYAGAYGQDCTKECPGGFNYVCHGHGTCDSGEVTSSGVCTCQLFWRGTPNCSFPVTGVFMILAVCQLCCLAVYFKKKWRGRVTEQRQLVALQEQLLEDQRQDIEDLNEGWRIQETDLVWEIQLAQGGYGQVWKGKWLQISQNVAIKKMFLKPAGDKSSSETSRSGNGDSRGQKEENLVDADGMVFREQEISLLMKTRHRRVVLFYGAGRLENTGEIFLVSELMKCDLRTRLDDTSEPFSFSDRRNVARDICEGMAFLHDRRLIHRDLKSLNILLEFGGRSRAKIADFGLSRFTQRMEKNKRRRKTRSFNELNALWNMSDNETKRSVINDSFNSDTAIDMTGQMGSILWMAPEIIKAWNDEIVSKERTGRAKYSASVDVYSMGIVFFEIVTRRLPWSEIKPPVTEKLSFKVLKGDRPVIKPEELKSLSSVALPDAMLMIDCMKKCWHQRPEKRPTFEVLLQQLGGSLGW